MKLILLFFHPGQWWHYKLIVLTTIIFKNKIHCRIQFTLFYIVNDNIASKSLSSGSISTTFFITEANFVFLQQTSNYTANKYFSLSICSKRQLNLKVKLVFFHMANDNITNQYFVAQVSSTTSTIVQFNLMSIHVVYNNIANEYFLPQICSTILSILQFKLMLFIWSTIALKINIYHKNFIQQYYSFYSSTYCFFI